ncbi:unnamed protein product [Lactuca saligna]|uniref:Uncharacterized protein n=1 Tax=Lactuca saligna TaxID=75948 RepID=A0AA35VTK6_LACSI|nr:unnamed protein product [Lactuca saligna]
MNHHRRKRRTKQSTTTTADGLGRRKRKTKGGSSEVTSNYTQSICTPRKIKTRVTCLFVGNVGLIFIKGNLKEVSEEIAKYKVKAPVNVVVPPDNTSLDPSQSPFFQVLNISTKTTKVLWKSSPLLSSSRRVIKVGSFKAVNLASCYSHIVLLFLLCMTIDMYLVFKVLDLTEEDLIEKFALCVLKVLNGKLNSQERLGKLHRF